MDYTADALIRAVRTTVRIPDGPSAMSDQDILDIANEETLYAIAPSVVQLEEEYYVTQVDIPVVSGQRDYDVPSGALGAKTRRVSIIDDAGNEYDLGFEPIEDEYRFSGSSRPAYGTQFAYTALGDSIRILPTPVLTQPLSLRVSYYRRPDTLVLGAEARLVLSVVGADTLVVDTGTPLAAGAYATVRTSAPHFGRRMDAKAVVSDDGSTVELSSGDVADVLADGSEYITLAGTTYVPDVPDVCQVPLRLLTSLSVAQTLGRVDLVPQLQARVDRAMNATLKLMETRQRGNASHVVNRNSLLRRRRGA